MKATYQQIVKALPPKQLSFLIAMSKACASYDTEVKEGNRIRAVRVNGMEWVRK
jgi:hypothetical protein